MTLIFAFFKYNKYSVILNVKINFTQNTSPKVNFFLQFNSNQLATPAEAPPRLPNTPLSPPPTPAAEVPAHPFHQELDPINEQNEQDQQII